MVMVKIILLGIFRWVFKMTVTLTRLANQRPNFKLKTPVSNNMNYCSSTNVNSHSGIYDAQGNRKSLKNSSSFFLNFKYEMG